MSLPETTLTALHVKARQRRKQAWRPGTRKNLTSAQVTFFQFSVVFGVDPRKPSIDNIGAFVELLVRSDKAPGTIRNYISAIKQFYEEAGAIHLDPMFQSLVWKAMIRGLVLTARPRMDARAAMARPDLEAMVTRCNAERGLLPLKVALIFGYLGYLRISNLAPETLTSFDPSRATTWADIIPKKEGVMVLLKWTKTLQAQKGVTPVPLPALPGSILCPLAAWRQYVLALPDVSERASTPLLLSTSEPSGTTITVSKLRAMFNSVADQVGLGKMGYTPHSLRRGGRRLASPRESQSAI